MFLFLKKDANLFSQAFCVAAFYTCNHAENHGGICLGKLIILDSEKGEGISHGQTFYQFLITVADCRRGSVFREKHQEYIHYQMIHCLFMDPLQDLDQFMECPVRDSFKGKTADGADGQSQKLKAF